MGGWVDDGTNGPPSTSSSWRSLSNSVAGVTAPDPRSPDPSNLSPSPRASGLSPELPRGAYLLFFAFLGFIVLQILPLPFGLVEILSPHRAALLTQLTDTPPAFASLSLVPADTLVFGLVTLLYGLFFQALVRLPLRRRDMVSLLNVLVLSAAAQAVFGFFKYAAGNRFFFLFFHRVETPEAALTGTLGNANHFALYLEMAIPLVLALALARLRLFERGQTLREGLLRLLGEEKRVLFYLAVLPLLGAALLLTRARAGVVTLALSLGLAGLMLLFVRAQGLRRRLALVLLPLLALAVVWGGGDTVRDFMKLKEKAEAGRGIGRFVRWPATLEMVRDHPVFGTGFGTYRYAYFLYDREGAQWVTHAHSDALETLADGGVPGGLLLVALLLVPLAATVRVWRRRRRTRIRLLGIGLIAAVFAALFHSLFEFALRIPSNMVVFVLLLALGWKVVNYKRGEGSTNAGVRGQGTGGR